jgi:hypothetical protein
MSLARQEQKQQKMELLHASPALSPWVFSLDSSNRALGDSCSRHRLLFVLPLLRHFPQQAPQQSTAPFLSYLPRKVASSNFGMFHHLFSVAKGSDVAGHKIHQVDVGPFDRLLPHMLASSPLSILGFLKLPSCTELC